jgi:Fe-S cluster assembly scaffold protein SufB
MSQKKNFKNIEIKPNGFLTLELPRQSKLILPAGVATAYLLSRSIRRATKEKLELTVLKAANAELVLWLDNTSDYQLDLSVVLTGERASASIIVVSRNDRFGQSRFNLKIRHLAPKTFGRLQFKALAAGHSLTEVSALHEIVTSAAGTNCSLQQAVLQLSPQARVLVAPNLQISNQRSEAYHGASCGGLSAEAVNYLMQRGLSKKISEKMLTTAFLQSATRLIKNQKLRQAVEKLIK